MSEPNIGMDQAELRRLEKAVGRAMLKAAPGEWTSIRAEYRSAGRHIEVDVFVAGPDRVEHSVRPPMEVVEGLGRLRSGMYQPGRGTWLSAVYAIEPPSSFTVDYDPDTEPRWRRLPPPIGFQDELRFFPRADDNIPDWLRQRAGLPPAGPPPGTPTPPGGMPQQTPGPAPAGPAQPPLGTPPAGNPLPPAGGQPWSPPAPPSAPPPPPGQPWAPAGAPAPSAPQPADQRWTPPPTS